MEKIIFKYLFNYLIENSILTKHQSGFIPGDSTVNQLLFIYNEISSNMDKGKELRFIFCDVSKAFDRVWHEGLIQKLKMYGIDGNLLLWFQNYLSDRIQRVSTEGYHSQFKVVNAGVPQGSVLGPLLFLLYINDITDNVSTNIKLFADDTSLYVIIDDNPAQAAQALADDLSNIGEWAGIWDIKFNPNKTKSVIFSRKHNKNHPPVTFQNRQITDTAVHKHLGLTLQEDATWKEHILNIYRKAYSRLNILRYIKFKVNRKSLIKIYTAFIRPILEYADIIWDNCTHQSKQLLESVQLEAARIITGLRSGTSHNKLYEEIGWESLSDRRNKHKHIMMYKIIHGLSPQYLQDILIPFINNQNDNPYSLRQSRLFNPPLCRTNNYFDSFFPQMCRITNNANPDLFNSSSLAAFKCKLNNNINAECESLQIFKFEGNRKANIIICQLRNSCSNLNFDLFNDHLLNSPTCACDIENETASHYFFDCPRYNAIRHSLFTSVDSYANHNHSNISTFLQGCPDCDKFVNIQILNDVQLFIGKSRRFNLYML
ncbi:hypothetical protein CI610_03303 [invertebrate metagenome]|uniref:Reverse transcriptase domain-containing protein n=1 Tax=invertebrate metagenome TaxID=1711999 RepID=A0A2H9T3G9_9ZZZZ